MQGQRGISKKNALLDLLISCPGDVKEEIILIETAVDELLMRY